MMTGKRVMVVGGTGKIGKHLVPKLVGLGNEVHALARFGKPGQRERLEALGVRCFTTDVTCPAAFHGIPNDYDAVFHEAALKFGSEADAEATVEINVRAVGRAMEHFAGTRAFLFASSGNVYADAAEPASEATPPRPPSLYAMTRLGGEWMVDYFSRRNQTPAVLQRIFYGYHEEFGVPTDIARQIRDGEPVDLTTERVNCIWLDDLMDAMIASWQVASVPPKVLNLTSPETYAVRDIAERLGELMGRKPTFKGTPKGTSLLGDASEMARLLGPPKTSLDEGLRRIARSVLAREHPLDHPTQWEKRDGFGK
ncbi:MAG TPA: NAD-dependent epimerase/dehydratase family protein [Planctomycetota bacterium]|nr:NAD-dependent epimerase/dehydratase family protein [Planctomycetota bacterium]